MRSLPLLLTAVLGCARTPPPPAEPYTPEVEYHDPMPSPAFMESRKSATVGVTDPALANLLHAHWGWHLQEYPRFATRLGVHDYDDRIARVGLSAMDRRDQQRRSFLVEAGGIDPDTLDRADRVTLQLFVQSLEQDLARRQCRFSEWNVSAHSNPLESYGELGQEFPVRSERDVANLVSRLHAVAPAIDTEVAMLRNGLADGLVGNAESMRRVLEMLDALLERPVEAWPMLAVLDELPPGMQERDAHAKAITREVELRIKPALGRYRDLVRDELLPRARSDEDGGLAALPLGKACYEARARSYTTLPLTPADIHAIGLREIERLDAEIAALGKKALGTDGLSQTLARLRSDPALYFDTSEAVEAAAQDALALAKTKMPEFFGRLPQADCVVERVPDYKAPFTTIAYYDGPHADGSKPGTYFINVYEPKTRPRFEARVLAVHEAIPGHHLQIAIAQELGELPAFRRHQGYTAFVEGWALYTERLADEMGMYEDDLDRLGMLSFDAWRAGRLVVDTGIHALGWSRQDAIDFLMHHTALTPSNIDNEVDRYIAWPGQALAYKIGQLEIWTLRRDAEAALGERFELTAFHDAVLTGGAVPLPVLQQQVAEYVRGATSPG